jgi:hypothetical protein
MKVACIRHIGSFVSYSSDSVSSPFLRARSCWQLRFRPCLHGLDRRREVWQSDSLSKCSMLIPPFKRSGRSNLMARDLFAIIDEVTNSLGDLRRLLEPLAILGGKRLGASSRQGSQPRGVKAAGRGSSRGRRGAQRRRPVSPAVRASRKLQGQYLAAIRLLTKGQRAQVKRVLRKDGKQAAIKAAKGMQKAA